MNEKDFTMSVSVNNVARVVDRAHSYIFKSISKIANFYRNEFVSSYSITFREQYCQRQTTTVTTSLLGPCEIVEDL